jgi:PEGA domain
VGGGRWFSANPSKQGETVFAVGNPKGIVSAVGKLNGRSHTLKIVKKGTSGIGFALSSSNLLDVLRRFYPKESVLAENLPTPIQTAANVPSPTPEVGIVDISEPLGAEIMVDKIYVGNAPASFSLAAGPHSFHVRGAGQDWIRDIILLKDSRVSIHRP